MLAFVRRSFGLLSFICGMVALVFLPAAAQASGSPGCGDPSLSQPFAPWLDYSSYELAPGGDFETSTWALSGGAAIVPGSEPYAATGTLGQYSLSLPTGATGGVARPAGALATGNPAAGDDSVTRATRALASDGKHARRIAH